MDIYNTINWLTGYIESLEYSDNVSSRQIKLLKEKFIELTESIDDLENEHQQRYDDLNEEYQEYYSNSSPNEDAPIIKRNFIDEEEAEDLPF